MGYSGALGTLIYEKNLMSKISCQTPLKILFWTEFRTLKNYCATSSVGAEVRYMAPIGHIFYVTDGNIMYLTDASRFLISCVIQHYAPVVGGGGGGGTDA